MKHKKGHFGGAPGKSSVWINGTAPLLERMSKESGLDRGTVVEMALKRLVEKPECAQYVEAKKILGA